MKQLMIAVTIVGFVSLISFGVVMANATATPDNTLQTSCPNCPVDGTGVAGSGILHDYMSTALANALGMDVEELITRRDAGETLFDIAATLDIDFDTLFELRNQARLEAIELAHADGVLTDDQYQFMLERSQSANGIGFGMGSNGQGPMQGGGGYGRGQRSGGMWNADGTQNPNCPNYQAAP